MSGIVALVGSGEFLPTMAAVDRHLLATLAAAEPRVAIVPTAAAEEGEEVLQRWADLGVAHFESLGAQAAAVLIRNRQEAADRANAAVLAAADLVYFSGGDPAFLAATLADTPALDAVLQAHHRGAMLVGCSAGAMALGSYTLDWRASRVGPPRWLPGWGAVPDVGVLAHFDRARRSRSEWIDQVAAAIPCGGTVLGIDEHTVLQVDADGHHVHGVGGVTVFQADGTRVYASGTRLDLRLP